MLASDIKAYYTKSSYSVFFFVPTLSVKVLTIRNASDDTCKYLGLQASEFKAMLVFVYLPQIDRDAPTRVHRPLQPALGPPMPARVPTCFSQTIGAQCSMLL